MFKWITALFGKQYELKARIHQMEERLHELDTHEDSIEAERLFIELQLPKLEMRLKLANPKLTPAEHEEIQPACNAWPIEPQNFGGEHEVAFRKASAEAKPGETVLSGEPRKEYSAVCAWQPGRHNFHPNDPILHEQD